MKSENEIKLRKLVKQEIIDQIAPANIDKFMAFAGVPEPTNIHDIPVGAGAETRLNYWMQLADTDTLIRIAEEELIGVDIDHLLE